MKKLFFTLFCCLPVWAFAQLANLDFENWYTDSTGASRLYNWEHLEFNSKPNNTMFATWKTTDAEHGSYALKLSRWYQYLSDIVRQRASISSRPSSLKGYYEYIDNNLTYLTSPRYDTASAAVWLTKWNTITSKNDTIGTGMAQLTFNNTYAAFTCPISYIDGRVPDSITIVIRPTQWAHSDGLCKDSGLCSFLTIDHLSLGAPSALAHLDVAHIDIYPNPATDKLILRPDNRVSPSSLRISITNVLGSIVYQSHLQQQTSIIDLTAFSPGNYFLVIQDDAGMLQVKKFVKQ